MWKMIGAGRGAVLLLQALCLYGAMANTRELKVIEFPTENANLSAS